MQEPLDRVKDVRAFVAMGLLAAVSALSACGGSAGPAQPVVGNGGVHSITPSPKASATPTGGGTATPTGGATATPSGGVTPTPKASATATAPATATPTPAFPPTPLPTGLFACSAPAISLPGTYVSFSVSGTVSGANFVADFGSSAYSVNLYVAATPAPTPSPTITPTPAPTGTPAPTPTPVTVTVYLGTYSLPAFTGTKITGGPYTANATNGCFFAIQYPAPIASGSPDTTFGLGSVNLGTQIAGETNVSVGAFNAFAINNITSGSTAGSFILDANGGNTSGTIAVTSKEVLTLVRARKLIEELRAHGGMGVYMRTR